MGKLSQTDRETIVAALLAGKLTLLEATAKYKVSTTTIERTFKRQVGKSLAVYTKMLKRA